MIRRFDEREVARILEMATKPRTSTALPATGGGDGLTLEQVKEIAAEAGIDVMRVEEAANTLVRAPEASGLDVFVGSPTNVRYDASVAGGLGDDARAEVVRLIRASLDTQGVVGGQGDSLEWMDKDGFGSRNVTVTPTADGTRVVVSGRFDVAAAGAAGVTGVTGAVGAIGTAMLVAASGPVGWLLVPATVAAMVAVPRLTIGAVVKRETRKLAGLAERIREALASENTT